MVFFFPPQLVGMIEDGWGTSTHQREDDTKTTSNILRHFCVGNLKPAASPWRQQSLERCWDLCKIGILVIDWITLCAAVPAWSLVPCPEIPV